MVAVTARVWLLPRVQPFMDGAGIALGEGLVAVAARERLLSRVHALVDGAASVRDE